MHRCCVCVFRRPKLIFFSAVEPLDSRLFSDGTSCHVTRLADSSGDCTRSTGIGEVIHRMRRRTVPSRQGVTERLPDRDSFTF